MMTPKKRVTIIVIISVLIALIFIFLVYAFLSNRKPKIDTAKETSAPVETQAPTPPTVSDQLLDKEKENRAQSAGVIALSKLFVERYGSYSNQANFQNIRDVIPLMSQKFASETENDLAGKTAPSGFYGITTRVIIVNVNQTDEQAGTASVLIKTQREEENNSAQNTSVNYQDIELTFVKEAGVWKVDSANWR